VSDVRRCGWCGARLGARDRVCFSCYRPLSEPVPLAATIWRLRTQGLGWNVGRG
jgi:hypothetical protein